MSECVCVRVCLSVCVCVCGLKPTIAAFTASKCIQPSFNIASVKFSSSEEAPSVKLKKAVPSQHQIYLSNEFKNLLEIKSENSKPEHSA